MRVLVTGSTGFLGSHIVDQLLARGDSVRALARPTSDASYLTEQGVEIVTGDVADLASLRPAVQDIEVVYHTAAKVSDWGPWSDFQSATIEGTRNVLKAASEAGAPRFLHVSTDGVYALSAFGARVTEESPLEKRFGWLDYYRRAKLAAEDEARRYAATGPMAVTIVRPGLLLGERDAAVLPGTVAFLKSGAAMYLGRGRNRLPYVYAGDVAAACILAATSDTTAGRVYNVASDEVVTQRDLFGTIAAAAGLSAPRRALPMRLSYTVALLMEAWCVLRGRRSRPAMTRFGVHMLALNYVEDASKLRREAGWAPAVPMAEAVRRSLEWQRERRSRQVGG